MEKIIKQVVGIDVGSKELVVCLGRMDERTTKELYAYRSFSNTSQGFKQLLQWVRKSTGSPMAIWYVMEATGVYHESLAYYLEQHQCYISIILPNKISNYFKTLNVKTVTDKTCSEAIALFGLERNLELWHSPHPVYKTTATNPRKRPIGARKDDD